MVPQKKRDITGALSQIKGQDLNDRPITNVVQGIQGKASGVDITSNNRPGGIGTLVSLLEGKKGQLSVQYNGSLSFDQIHSTTEWMDSKALLDWQMQSHINGGTYTGKYGTAPDPDFDVQNFGGGESYGIESIRKAYSWDADGKVLLRDATPQEIAAGYAQQVPVYNGGNLPNQGWIDLVTLDELEIRDSFYALYFNTKLDVVGYRKIADGGLDAVMVDMRLIMSSALL